MVEWQRLFYVPVRQDTTAPKRGMWHVCSVPLGTLVQVVQPQKLYAQQEHEQLLAQQLVLPAPHLQLLQDTTALWIAQLLLVNSAQQDSTVLVVWQLLWPVRRDTTVPRVHPVQLSVRCAQEAVTTAHPRPPLSMDTSFVHLVTTVLQWLRQCVLHVPQPRGFTVPIPLEQQSTVRQRRVQRGITVLEERLPKYRVPLR